jgi:hypothetical protein
MAEKKDTSGAPLHECLAPNDEGAAPGGPSTPPSPSARPEPVAGTGTGQPAASVSNVNESERTVKRSCLRFLLEIIKNEKAKCL